MKIGHGSNSGIQGLRNLGKFRNLGIGELRDWGISDLVIHFEKMAVNLCTSRNCMKIGHGSNSGIQGFRNLGI